MIAKLKSGSDEIQWWGWSLPRTREVISSFDRFAALLGPEERTWPPSHPQKVDGEIRPRTKTLQHTLRSVMVFQGSGDQLKSVKVMMLKLAQEIDYFLEDIRMISHPENANTVKGGNWRDMRELGEMGNLNGSSITLRRCRAGLHKTLKTQMISRIKILEEKTRTDLVTLENIMRPPRIIKLGGSSVPVPESEDENNGSEMLQRVHYMLIELLQEVWDSLAQIIARWVQYQRN